MVSFSKFISMKTLRELELATLIPSPHQEPLNFANSAKLKHKNEGDSNLEAKTARLLSSPPLCGKDKMVPTGSNH